MLTKMEVFSPQLSPPDFSFDEDGTANSDKIHIRNMDGIGPVKAAINTTQYGGLDGAFFTGASVGARNIVLTVGLHPDWDDYTMEDLRQILYAYFMPKYPVKLRFHSTHLPTVDISGYVESMDPNIFSKDPEIQVSIICPQPDFLGIESVTVDGDVGEQEDFDFVDVMYPGTLATGFVIKVTKTDALATYDGAIYILTKAAFTKSFYSEALVDADVYFQMQSLPGDLYIRNVGVTDGLISNLLRTVAFDAEWPLLLPGANQVAVIADTPGQAWEMTYIPRFGGL